MSRQIVDFTEQDQEELSGKYRFNDSGWPVVPTLLLPRQIHTNRPVHMFSEALRQMEGIIANGRSTMQRI